MPRTLHIAPLLLFVAACGVKGDGKGEKHQGDPTAPSAASIVSIDPLGSHDPSPGVALDPSLADDQPRPVMQLQVVLDRLGFTPGVVDGREGLSTRNAIAGFQEAQNLPVTGKVDPATLAKLEAWKNIPATRVVTIPDDFAAGPFQPTPAKVADQAKLDRLGYQSLDEKLAERFHTTPETLAMLNPGGAPASAETPGAGGAQVTSVGRFRAGQQVRVPNVGADRIEPNAPDDRGWRATLASLGVGSAQPAAAKIVVSKSAGTLKAYDAAGKLIGMYTATMGSHRDPLPLGSWKITAILHSPDFAYDPDLLWDVPDNVTKQRLPPGPNGPVGVAWLDLDKEHYGIHGTPEPSTIGRAQSHGCVRLTNWNVARLAQMVRVGTQVAFEAK